MRYRLLLLPLSAAGCLSSPGAQAQYYPYPPGYYAPGYNPPSYYRAPPQYYSAPPYQPYYSAPPAYSVPPAYAAPPAYTAPPNYGSANCGTPDQFKPCTR
jgi:hypothetical protein